MLKKIISKVQVITYYSHQHILDPSKETEIFQRETSLISHGMFTCDYELNYFSEVEGSNYKVIHEALKCLPLP